MKIAALFLALAAMACITPMSEENHMLAITHVTVVDVTGAPSQSDMTILTSGERITSILPSFDARIPKTAQVIDGKGGWLIPGLWDMHVHAHREGRTPSFYPLFVAHGVTGVREMGSHLASLLAWRQAWKNDSMAPRVIWSTPMFDGDPPIWRHGLAVETPEAGRALVRNMKASGFDFVKIYSKLSRDVYFAIADEAKKDSIPFAGHVPFLITPAEASRAGQRSIEHMTGVLESCIPGALEQAAESISPEKARLRMDELLNRSKSSDYREASQKLFSEFVSDGTWLVPTLVTARGATFVDDDSFAQDARLVYVLPHIRKRWEEYKHSLKPEDAAIGRRYTQRMVELAGELYRAKVGLLAGTDASDEPWVFAGSSLHDELELLAQAGLTPLAALQTATLNAAKFLGKTETMGTIGPGKSADLVLLDADPLADIRNTKKIRAVVLRGRYLDRLALDGLLAEARALAK